MFISDTPSEVENISVCEGHQNLTIGLGECIMCQHQYNWTLDDAPLPVNVIAGKAGLFIPRVVRDHYGVYMAVPANKRCKKRILRVDMCNGMYLTRKDKDFTYMK